MLTAPATGRQKFLFEFNRPRGGGVCHFGLHQARQFIEALPARGIERFELRSLHVEGDLAYITWNVGSDIPLGTDTFVVDDGKIVAQTFAMYAPPAHRG